MPILIRLLKAHHGCWGFCVTYKSPGYVFQMKSLTTIVLNVHKTFNLGKKRGQYRLAWADTLRESRSLFLSCTHCWVCWGPAPGWDPSAASSSPGSSLLSRAGRTLGPGYWAPPPLPDRNLGSVRQSIKGSLGQSERRNKFSPSIQSIINIQWLLL